MPIPTLAILSTLLHLYIGVRLVPALLDWPLAAALLTLMLMASACAMPRPFLATRRSSKPDRVGPAGQWAGFVSMGWFSSLLLLTLLRDMAALVLWAVPAAGAAASFRTPGMAAWSACAVVLAACAASLLGLLGARRTARVKHVEVPMAHLPPSLHGFTLAQLSDLHVGPTIRRRYVERIVRKVNGLAADAVVITGDLVDGSVSQLREHVAPLADLRSRHGSFVVTGNHEYYAGATQWVAELRRLGLHVLMNEHVLLSGRDETAATRLVLAGVTDFNAGHFDPAQASDPALALAGAPAEAATRVLLAHQPRSAPAAAAAGFHLQLSGHTHGGQFWPWNLFVPLQQPLVAGLHVLHGMWVYVSRGTGYWGPPKRLGAPSEITLVRLVRPE